MSPDSKGAKGKGGSSPNSKGAVSSQGKGKQSNSGCKGKAPNKGNVPDSSMPPAGILKRSPTTDMETPDRSVRRRVSFDSAVSTTGPLSVRVNPNKLRVLFIVWLGFEPNSSTFLIPET